MEDTRQLIAAFHEINQSEDRKVSLFTPALVGMIGSGEMFDALLAEFEAALSSGRIQPQLKERARNLAGTFVPQVAGLNSISDLAPEQVSAEELRGLDATTPTGRKNGVRTILSGLLRILNEVKELNS